MQFYSVVDVVASPFVSFRFPSYNNWKRTKGITITGQSSIYSRNVMIGHICTRRYRFGQHAGARLYSPAVVTPRVFYMYMYLWILASFPANTVSYSRW